MTEVAAYLSEMRMDGAYHPPGANLFNSLTIIITDLP
jgi:hypothetical protein